MLSTPATTTTTAIITEAYVETSEDLESSTSNTAKLGVEISRYVRLWVYSLPFCGSKVRQRNAKKVKAVYGTNISQKGGNAPQESTRQSRWLSALMRLGAGDKTTAAQQETAAAHAAETPQAVAFKGTTKERLEHSFRTSVAVRLTLHEKRALVRCVGLYA